VAQHDFAAQHGCAAQQNIWSLLCLNFCNLACHSTSAILSLDVSFLWAQAACLSLARAFVSPSRACAQLTPFSFLNSVPVAAAMSRKSTSILYFLFTLFELFVGSSPYLPYLILKKAKITLIQLKSHSSIISQFNLH